MADYLKRLSRSGQHGGTPYGDMVSYPYSFATTSGGVPTDSDATVAMTAADTIKLGIIPAGTKLLDMIAYLSDAFTATATAKIGFAYVDGVDDAAVPQDADYFVAALDLNTVAVSRKTNAAPPVTLQKDAYLVMDLDVATLAAAGRLDIQVIGQLVGVN
jgi:3D (Asp-Asp-Asp) domain-containing protein